MVQQRESSPAQKEESCQVEQGGGVVQGSALNRLNLNLTSILTKLKMSLTLILTKVNSISGLKNAFHRHCHLLSVLHLLAQTSLPTSLTTSLRLKDPLHHLHLFFEEYSKSSSFFPHLIIQSPSIFNVDDYPDSPADLIRLFVDLFEEVESTLKTTLEWSFECSSCRRFTRTRIKESVLRIDARESDSFAEMLDKFFNSRTCICGEICAAELSSASTGGDFLFIDLNRTTSTTSTTSTSPFLEQEVALFPLRLGRQYKIVNTLYKVFATINLNLDYAEGGHYSTNVFVGDGDELICLHEDNVDLQAASLSFDSTTMVVALKKEVNDENATRENNEWTNSGSRKESNYISSRQPCENTRGDSSFRNTTNPKRRRQRLKLENSAIFVLQASLQIACGQLIQSL